MSKSFKEKLQTDIILLDGAFGTYFQALGLKDELFKDKPGCMEYLSIAAPDFVSRIHNDYLEAGSDAVETNTFGGNAIKLSEYGLEKDAYQINLVSTKLARAAADSFSDEDNPRYVVGSMGPTGKLPSSRDPVLGDVTFEEIEKTFYDQALGLIDGGADALLIETGQDLLEMKAAVIGAKEALKARGKDLAVMAQCTLANNGRMLLGTEVSAVMATLGYLGVDVVGLNCSTGPVEMEGALRMLSDNCSTFISCVPNAGLPVEEEGRTVYPLSPREMAGIISGFVKKYGIDVVGGCCGTNPEHIREIKKVLRKAKKRKKPTNTFYSSFYRGFDLKEKDRPIKIGERINTQGSRKVKELLEAEDYDSVVEIGKNQQKYGADILDVCSVLTERSTEERDSVILSRSLSESVQIPIMIDSTSSDVIEAALEAYPGTAFINSVNLEDGGQKVRRIFDFAKKHASFVVNLVIDENGMGKTVARKLEIAQRLYDIATEEYGLEPHRLLFDMLVFTLGTGEKEYADAAVNTMEAIKQFKKQNPDALTVLGVSNVSFGLSKEARKVLNMVFLHHAVKSGLDTAIVNPIEFISYKDIPRKERKLTEDLLFNRDPEALTRLVEYFAQKKPVGEAAQALSAARDLSIEEKLKKCILERNKSGILPLVDEAMKTHAPEDIVNNILMDAMKEVGDRLDSGEMVLPYVLQSAEVMRKAIEYLSGYMPKEKAGKRGKILLATVFGDVHDIGKNLVKMILENNGFSVIDLGKQVSVEKIISEAKKHKVDAVGLSALLVSTARHMKTCVQSMCDAGLDYPVLVGGAPVNKKFTADISTLKDNSIYKGGVFYARDAFTGLKIMQSLMDTDKRETTMAEYEKQFEETAQASGSGTQARTPDAASRTPHSGDTPVPPFFGVRALSNIPVDDVFKYLDERMVFEIAWGATIKDKLEKKRIIDEEYRPLLHELKEEALRKGWLDLKAVYGYFKCRITGEDMEVIDEAGTSLETFHFARGKDEKAIALSDYFSKGEEGDVVVFQAVTAGKKIFDAINGFNKNKEFTKAYLLHGMSVNLAEALAAYLHDRIREEMDLNKDQGRRYSPGYPLWKDMKDQEKIFRLLGVEERIGVRLTEGYQMTPEASTTAMIVHNDRAEYSASPFD
ncbi:MAG: methionine synthase [Candidatus Omnitrophica bacterium]|nr:methionine synthase [Candidatus Omnitrophota bacterium]